MKLFWLIIGILIGANCFGCDVSDNGADNVCEKVMRARCMQNRQFITCALESNTHSRLDLHTLMSPVLEGDMVCGPWRAP